VEKPHHHNSKAEHTSWGDTSGELLDRPQSDRAGPALPTLPQFDSCPVNLIWLAEVLTPLLRWVHLRCHETTGGRMRKRRKWGVKNAGENEMKRGREFAGKRKRDAHQWGYELGDKEGVRGKREVVCSGKVMWRREEIFGEKGEEGLFIDFCVR
jgi:hypothetical protein